MAWYFYLAYFVGGLLLTNGVPHFINGISGRRFQTPFASPPGVGESSPIVNILWAMVNFAIGYTIIFEVGDFEVGMSRAILMVGLGIFAAAAGLAVYFGKLHQKE